MIQELTKPIKQWMGPNHLHKGFYTFNFDKPDGRQFIKNSYCYPEQNYLTKRFSGKWKYIEFAFQSWSRDPCNSFGIHMAAFNPKPWFKQPIGSSISNNKKYDPYSENSDIKKIRIPIAIKEDTKSLACLLCSHNLFIHILSSKSTSPSVDIIRQHMSIILFL